ncbi:hypothetical protein HMPREF2710_02675 [Rothia sp. HMSC069D01]|nr:hypothetical protein HMPREF2710_02675 [Rothia sp. HMSC069D01]
MMLHSLVFLKQKNAELLKCMKHHMERIFQRAFPKFSLGRSIRCIKHGAREMMVETLTLFALKKSKNNQLMS